MKENSVNYNSLSLFNFHFYCWGTDKKKGIKKKADSIYRKSSRINAMPLVFMEINC